MSDIFKILSPLLFLRIEGPSLSKVRYIWPLIVAVPVTALFLFVPENINIFGANGFIKSINSLLAVLMGFFVAALAAVASFPEPSLNKKLAGSKPTTLTVTRSGQAVKEQLTRRKFLCLLFGYEAFITLFVYIIGEFSYLLAGNIKSVVPVAGHCWMMGAFLFVYISLLSNLLFTMLLGLHHLAERMHRP